MGGNEKEENHMKGFCVCAVASGFSGAAGFFYFGGYIGLWSLLAAAIPFVLSVWGIILSRKAS